MDAIRNPSHCILSQTIRTGPINPDVGGIAVGGSNIAINVLLPILFHWSKHDLETSTFMLYSQVYPVLFATASMTASPVSVYLVYSSYRDVCRCPNVLFQQITSSKSILRFLGLLLFPFWLFVNLMASFYAKAFSDSENCVGMKPSLWFEFQIVSSFLGALDVLGKRDLITDLMKRGGLGTVSLAGGWIWMLYLVRHKDDIYDEYQTRRLEKRCLSKAKRWFFAFWDIPMASWFVVTTSHPWTIFFMVVCFHWSWIIGILRGLTFDGYQFNYGQVTAVFSVLPPLVAVSELCASRWTDITNYIKRRPRYIWISVKFLLTGRPNPWEQFIPIPIRHASWSPRQWLGVIVVWFAASVLQAFGIMEYVKAGSMPNTRIPGVNSRHQQWKPFSISLHATGVMVCFMNILVWVSYFKFVRWWNPHKTSMAIKYLNRAFHLAVVLPISFIMSAGPLFAPSAGLSLTQQHQWTHTCDPFAGEAILRSPSLGSSQQPLISFYYSGTPESTTRIHYFDYEITSDSSSPTQTLSFAGTAPHVTIPPDLQPNIQSISFAPGGQSNVISANCTTTIDGATVPFQCGTGTFHTSPYLDFSLEDSFTGNTTYRLRAEEKEWRFSDDAPKFILRHYSSNQQLGDIAIQTALTERNHCEVSKVCLGSRKLGIDILSPLGVTLLTQNNFASYCTQPRLYIV